MSEEIPTSTDNNKLTNQGLARLDPNLRDLRDLIQADAEERAAQDIPLPPKEDHELTIPEALARYKLGAIDVIKAIQYNLQFPKTRMQAAQELCKVAGYYKSTVTHEGQIDHVHSQAPITNDELERRLKIIEQRKQAIDSAPQYASSIDLITGKIIDVNPAPSPNDGD